MKNAMSQWVGNYLYADYEFKPKRRRTTRTDWQAKRKAKRRRRAAKGYS